MEGNFPRPQSGVIATFGFDSREGYITITNEYLGVNELEVMIYLVEEYGHLQDFELGEFEVFTE